MHYNNRLKKETHLFMSIDIEKALEKKSIYKNNYQ